MKLGQKFVWKALALGLCVASLSLTALAAGWGQQDGKYYFVDPKTDQRVSGKWIHTSSGYYYIGADTYMVTGWKMINDKWYYFYEKTEGNMPKGAMAQNTVINGYRVDSNGAWIK